MLLVFFLLYVVVAVSTLIYDLSGDTDGRLWFWDWKSSKVFRKIKCHDQVCISAIWHPFVPSAVATCSWDGTIKFCTKN